MVQPLPATPGGSATAPDTTTTPDAADTPVPIDPAILAQYEMPSVARRSLALIGPSGPREGAMRAVVAWLNTMNATHAIKHGVARLVWCKENTRTGGSLQRTFYHTDLVTKRQKPCANATAALALMQELTGEDFYADMLTKWQLFVTDGNTPTPIAVARG